VRGRAGAAARARDILRSMTKPFLLCADPLARFGAIYRALLEHKRWSDDVTSLRYSALTLVTAEGEPDDVAQRLLGVADVLKEGAGWFGPLRSSIRFAVAAILLRSEQGATAFTDEVERVSRLLRERGMRRGSTYEVLAILILQQADPDRHVDDADVARMDALYRMMKEQHGWLTGPDDYPACALLAGRDEPVAELERRIEAAYEGLRAKGYSRGNKLQMASHVLCFDERPADEVVARFDELYQGFRARGLWMSSGDYDEIAVLTFLHHPVERILDRVAEHRAVICELPRRPSKDVGFSLACSTVFLELVQLTEDLRSISDATLLANVQAILSAQAAATAAAAASSAAAASAAAG